MTQPPNILDVWNGYREIFSFSQALEISRQYLLLRTVILQKKSLAMGAPKKKKHTHSKTTRRILINKH